ncbi:hypothetical protein ACNPQM_41875 [Streptomyces sp. NPDC056231]|uniref:hypothetical protein n=1 Tax=Streptomyces sp. NPDC056231 TaxID=3345755 RepID=UPI003AB092E9
MTDGTTWLADRQSIAFGGYRVVLACGLSPQELVKRLAATLLYDTEHIVVPVGDHTGASLLELMDDHYDVGLRLGSVGGWTYAVAYGERLTAAGLPDPERNRREVHRAALGVVEEFFGLSLPRDPIVSGALPAVLLEPA